MSLQSNAVGIALDSPALNQPSSNIAVEVYFVSRKKQQEPQLLLDLDFDAESDRLYGVQAFSNTPSPGAGAIRGATPPPPPSPPPSPPGPPPAAPREKVKSRSQTPDLQRPGSAAETVEQATPNDQPEPARALEDVREPEGQDPSNSAVDASSKEVLEYLR